MINRIKREDLHEFHNISIALLRWNLKDDQLELHKMITNNYLEYFHSEFLINGFEIEEFYDVILGEILKYDPNYILRKVKFQSSLQKSLSSLQSNLSNEQVVELYPKMIKEIIQSWYDSKNDMIPTDFLSHCKKVWKIHSYRLRG